MKKTIFAVVMVVLLLLSMSLVGGAALAADDYGNTEIGFQTEIPIVLGIDVTTGNPLDNHSIDFGPVAGDEVSMTPEPERKIFVDSQWSEWIGDMEVTHGSNCDQWIDTEIKGEERNVTGEKLGHTNGLLTMFGPTDYTPIDPSPAPVVKLNGTPQTSGVTVYPNGMVEFTGGAPLGGQLVTIDYTSKSNLYSSNMTFNDLALGPVNPDDTEVLAMKYSRGLVDNEEAVAVAQIYVPHDYPYGANNFETAQVVFYATPDVGIFLNITNNGNGTTDPPVGRYQYDEGEDAIITANPNEGSHFVNWTGEVPAGHETDNPLTITMDASKKVTANFALTYYTLTMAVVGDGTTSPAVGPHTYLEGTLVNITATQGSSAEFSGWSGDVASPGSASTTVLMDADKTVTANFGNVFALTILVDPVASGSTNPAAGVHYYSDGDMPTITAIGTTYNPQAPGPVWNFVNWTGDVADPGSATTTVTMDAAKTVTAHFALDHAPAVAITSPLNNDKVSGMVPIEATLTDDISIVMAGFAVDDPYSAVPIPTIPASGTSVDTDFAWDSTGVADGVHQLYVMARDSAGQGAFTLVNVNVDNIIDYDLTMAVDPVASGSTDPAVGIHPHIAGDVVTITAIGTTYDPKAPGPVWNFDHWNGDVADPGSATTTVTMDAAKTVTAVFVLDHAPAVAITSPSNGNTVSGMVPIDATLTDDISVVMGGFAVDDPYSAVPIPTIPASGTSVDTDYAWDSTGVANGPHTLYVMARDSAGQGAFTLVNVTVSNVIPVPVSWGYETYYEDPALIGITNYPETRHWTLNDEGVVNDMVIGLDPTTIPNTAMETVGTGDGSNRDFSLDHAPVVPGTDVLLVGTSVKIRDTDYTINNDTGAIHFITTPPAAGVVVKAAYKYFADTWVGDVQYINNVLPPATMGPPDSNWQSGQVLFKGPSMAVLAVQKDYYDIVTGHKVYVEGAIYLFGTSLITAYQSLEWTDATHYTQYVIMVPGTVSASLNELHHLQSGGTEDILAVDAAGDPYTYTCNVTLDYLDALETAEDSNVYGKPLDAWKNPSDVPILVRTEWRDQDGAGLIKFEISSYNYPMTATLESITWSS